MGTIGSTDALTDVHAGDPYPVYAWLRESEPVYRCRTGAYLLTRYTDCRRVLTERACFLAPGPLRPSAGTAGACAPVLSRVMSAQNPPRHTRMRAAVARRFVEHVRGQQPWVSRLCDRLLDGVVERLRYGVADMSPLAEAFARDTIMHVLGLPQGDRERLCALVSDIFPTSGPLPGQECDGAVAMRQLTDYLHGQVARRRRAPGDDLMSELVEAHTACPEALPHEELVSILTGLTVAGYPQIAAGIETGIVLMIRHPKWAVFLDDAAGARMFVEEVLRYDAPVQFTPAPRIPARTVVLSGVTIPAGAHLWPVLGAANRDPGVFTRPDAFWPGRGGARHLSFGGGAHYCLGAELVYLEMVMLLRRLRQRLPDLAQARPPAQRVGRLRGFTSVAVRRAEADRHDR
ncbi:cytochrome P450 [Streptomyces sp. NPDC001530]|uniref:cytochrome P450 n=1 Tax=Streptomyces sp. NPDC001530 TaxID=3364582 RepID=UPI0036AFF3B0